MEELTKKEREVLVLAGKGLKTKEIGKQLGISHRTVNTHLGNIYDKLEVRTRGKAVALALMEGIITLEEI